MRVVGGTADAIPLTGSEREARRRGMVFGAYVMEQFRNAEINARLLGALDLVAQTEPDPLKERDAYVLKFYNDSAVTTIRIVFNDRQSGADLVITHMTTLPDDTKSKGFGSKSLAILLSLAVQYGFAKIQAAQVQKPSEDFWIKTALSRFAIQPTTLRMC